MIDEDKCVGAIARGLDEALRIAYGRKMGFCLVIAPLDGESDMGDYVANVTREGSIRCLRGTADRLEKPDTHETRH